MEIRRWAGAGETLTGTDVSALSARSVDCLPAGGLDSLLGRKSSLRVKLGIDPTAPDIHLGHVVVLTKLREFQDAGHQVVLIIGDFTARVGDPSGRSNQRPILSTEQISANAETFQEQAFTVLDPERTEVRFNSEWLEMPPQQLLGLLSTTTVARLLERDDFRKRMEADQPVSALELLYPVLQGYDSVAIEADVELGGTDQMFNLLFGRDVQTTHGMAPQVVMTMPILPGLDGVQRMSKSSGNYVGVTESPDEMFGKLMSIPDSVMPEYWELLLPGEESGEQPANLAKRELARRIVDRFHGEGSGALAEETFDRVFVRHEPPEEVAEHRVDDGLVHLPRELSEAFGISTSEARRVLSQGGVKLDGEPLEGTTLDLPADELDGRIVQIGKRRFARFLKGS